jgi:chaperonin GroES
MKVRPLRNWVIVRQDSAEEKIGSIYIPEKAQMKPRKGEVLSVGPGKFDEHGKRVPMDVKAGDVVLYDKFSGSEVKEAGDRVIILSEDHILGVVEA